MVLIIPHRTDRKISEWVDMFVWQICHLYNRGLWASEMAQRVKSLAAKTSNLTSSPGGHVVEGKNWLLQAVLWLPRHKVAGMHTAPHPYTQTQINAMKKLFKHAVSLFVSFNNCRFWRQEATYVLSGTSYSLFSLAPSPTMLCVVLGAGSLLTKALIGINEPLPREKTACKKCPVQWIHRYIY